MKRLIIIIAIIAALFAANIVWGAVAIDKVTPKIINYRVANATTALLSGALLATAGLLLQTAFHNPLAGPSILGISGGASLGVALATLAGVGVLGIGALVANVAAALVGALAVTALLLLLSTMLRNNIVLLIVGMLLSYLITAVITILNNVATAERLRSYVAWGMGDFTGVGSERLPLFATVALALLVGCVLMIKPLNALQLGDQYAENLGVNLRRLRNILLLLVGGATALTTAFCGPVAFIGLAVPHIARMVVRSDNFIVLMPATILCGAATALLCQLPSAVCALPLNALTPIVGVPVIVYVIIQHQKSSHL